MARTLFRFGSCLNERKVNAPFSLRSCYRFHIKLHNIRGLFASMPESYSIKAEVILVMTQLSTPTRTPTFSDVTRIYTVMATEGRANGLPILLSRWSRLPRELKFIIPLTRYQDTDVAECGLDLGNFSTLKSRLATSIPSGTDL